MSEDVRRCSKSQKNKNGTVWRCPREFSIAEHGDCKMCPHHREKAKRDNKSTKGKAAQARYAKTEKGATKRVRHSKTETFKAAQKKFRQSENGLAGGVKRTAKYKSTENGAATVRAYSASDAGKASQKKFAQSEKGKIVKKRQSDKPMSKITSSIRQMMLGIHENPISVPKLGCFRNNDDVSTHMESTFDDWMHWGNHGTMPGVQNPKTTWHIGHRLPKAIFDATVFEDMKRCWHASNLFAQCAKENMENGARCVLSDTELLALSEFWPLRAKEDFATLKSLFVA